jgi:aspartyl/asparaginyl beta-hydroxylase (cupin superfamily)
MIQIYHLALKVPEAESEEKRPYISVKECDDEEETLNCRSQEYRWTEGREFIFDDSFTHYAENPTDEERLVLFLHIKRIDFRGWREELIASIMCYIFSWVPFESVIRLVKGTEKTCVVATVP